ncbi:hypothetical protein F4801DRAFT_533318 [Xylaria longipes]|nr:hypothetical protein F4801DRAFT_533318 [Xylaria longipes]RYC59640.1 hypothetical protein CHU98_g6561 [Xylaria longipes]
MHRPGALARPRSICQICESISRTQRHRVASPLVAAARNAPRRPYQSRQPTIAFAPPQRRALSSTVSPASNQTPPAESRPDELAQVESLVAEVVAYMDTLLSKTSPSEQDVSSALGVCHILADRFTDESVQPQLAHAISELNSTASTLLSLDDQARTESQPPQQSEYPAELREYINKISETAYSIMAYSPVFITPRLLKQYVQVQAKLGRPETLPKVFQLYGSKPLPKEGSDPVTYTEQKPGRAANAIESEVVDIALDTAIAAKNLDAAVGVIENSYGTTAFVRSKLLRYGLLPLGTFAATPVAAYLLANNFSGLQQTMESATATGVAFAGILAYVGFTASLGFVALTTANDQMKRVTWAPGMALRKRWIREEERAALDKIACAWGFQEPWRQGEEEGADWDALREYIGQKGMVLDRTELMEGMS